MTSLLRTFKWPETPPATITLGVSTFGPRGEIDGLRQFIPESCRLPTYSEGALAHAGLRLIALAFDDGPAVVCDYQELSSPERLALLDAVLNRGHVLFGHHIGGDLAFLMREATRLGIEITGGPQVVDTAHILRLLTDQDPHLLPDKGRMSLETCVREFLEYSIPRPPVGSNERPSQADAASLGQRVDAVRKLVDEFFSGDAGRRVDRLMKALCFEGTAAWHVARMAARGIAVDFRRFLEMTGTLAKQHLAEREGIRLSTGIDDLNDRTFGRFLVAQGVDLPLSASGVPRCTTGVLNVVRDQHPSIPLFLSYRKTKSELDAVLSLWSGFDAVTERIYADWTSWSAPSGRMSAAKPNLLGLPKSVRSIFIPSKSDGALVVADLSQIQVRVVAKVSGCSRLSGEFLNGGDVHRALAAQIYGKTEEEISSDERRAAKAGVFGFLFGGGINAFVEAQHNRGNMIDFSDAKRIKESFEATFPGVAAWQQETFTAVDRSRSEGLVKATTGGIPYTARAGTEALNYPVQAVDAVILKRFLMEADNRGWSTVCVVHDEVIVEDASVAEVVDLLEQIGTEVLDFPVEAEGDSRASWAA